jgi:HSP20 family protein
MAITRYFNRFQLVPRPIMEDLPERFRQMFEGGMTLEPLMQSIGWNPAMEIVEKDDALVVTAELPGIPAKDVDISVEDGVLTISGEKKEEHEESKDDARYHMWERRYGAFRRTLTLPQAVDAEKISAKSDDGILTITLPKTKKAKAQGRKIPVTNGGK